MTALSVIQSDGLRPSSYAAKRAVIEAPLFIKGCFALTLRFYFYSLFYFYLWLTAYM
jgi:hypothetical protein